MISEANQTVTVISRKFDGSVSRAWECRLIEQKGPLLSFVGEFESDVQHSELGFIRRGTVSYEYYWLDRWYNVFRFHEPDQVLRNYYCNINMPPRFESETIDYVDLDIDVLVSSDLSYRILDLDDYEVNAQRFGYSEEIRQNVTRSLHELIALIEGREFPFDYCG